MIAQKQCTKCREEKPATQDFFRPRRGQCRVCAAAQQRAYRDANREKMRARRRAYYAANREEELANRRAYYAANREEERASKRAYYAAHRKELISRVRAYQVDNPEKVRANYALRRARLAGVTTERFHLGDVWRRDGGVCGICTQPVDPCNWHLDHIVPISRGGPHSLDNVQVSHPACNMSKGSRMLH